MKYTEEMILHSDSGYCMPFEEPRGKDVELSLGYGEQVHPTTGEKFFHHGIDFKARYYILSAVASGIVSGVGNDPVHGICQTGRYGGPVPDRANTGFPVAPATLHGHARKNVAVRRVRVGRKAETERSLV